MTEPICVITPCFNAAPFLNACLESVAAQGDCVQRHIVMDGESSDGSISILEKFSKRTPKLLYRSARDAGQADALNKALGFVDTTYFAWLNADDCLLPGKLRTLIDATGGVSKPAIVYGDYQIIDVNGRLLKRRRQPSFDYWDCLYSYLTVQNSAAIFNTELCRAVGGFNPEFEFCMDYDIILRVARRGSVRHVREYVGSFRHHAGAKTSRLPDLCAKETALLRLKISDRSPAGLKLLYFISKIRVVARMFTEGCIKSRLQRYSKSAA